MTRKTISEDQPALVVDNVVKRFNAVSEPWWRRKKDTTNGHNDHNQPLKARRGKELITAVDHVSFTVQPREIFGVLGPNAARR